MRGRAVALVLALLGALVPGVASAGVLREGCIDCGHPTARGGDGTITIEHGTSDVVPGRRGTSPGAGGNRDYYYVNEYATPTCSGNTLHGADILCPGAVVTCPALDQVRFWIWHQRVDVKQGNPDTVTPGPWNELPGTYCLGPDDPGVPQIVRSLAAAQDLFERKVQALPAPTVRTVPGPRTLVHYLTQFRASGAEAFSFQVTVAGATVHSYARPVSYRWTFGDGSTAVTSGPTTSHTYPVKRQLTIRVDITWGGYYTVDGGSERYDIDPPATSTGRTAVIRAVEARAQNIA